MHPSLHASVDSLCRYMQDYGRVAEVVRLAILKYQLRAQVQHVHVLVSVKAR
jgi:hypothetical protein